MHFTYCPDCGQKLTSRQLGDEGDVAWCDNCSKPWFDVFPTAIIALVYNEKGEVLLLRQNYISTRSCNLVSGYIKPGEDAETCAIREILEETGQQVEQLQLKVTSWFERKQMLMIGFFARVNSRELRLSTEVDSASWHRPEEILSLVINRPGSTANLLCRLYLKSLQAPSLEQS